MKQRSYALATVAQKLIESSEVVSEC
jgi:hypothetical protein